MILHSCVQTGGGAGMSERSSYDDGAVGLLADKPVFGSAGAHQNNRQGRGKNLDFWSIGVWV